MKTINSYIILLIGIVLAVVITSATVLGLGVLSILLALFHGFDTKYGRYTYNLWLAFDKLWNAIRGGDSRETISSAIGKSVYFDKYPVLFSRKLDMFLARLLDTVDEDHCWKSIDWAVGEPRGEEETGTNTSGQARGNPLSGRK